MITLVIFYQIRTMTSTDNNAVCSCGVLNRKFMYSVLAVPGTKLFRWFYRYWLTIASNSTETFQNTPSQPTKTFHTTVTNKMKFSRPALLVALYGYGILKNDTVDAQQPFRVRAALVRSFVGWLVGSFVLAFMMKPPYGRHALCITPCSTHYHEQHVSPFALYSFWNLSLQTQRLNYHISTKSITTAIQLSVALKSP